MSTNSTYTRFSGNFRERTIPFQFNRGGESCGSNNTSPSSVCILEEIWGYKMKELCFTTYLSQSSTGGLPELLDIYTILMFWKHQQIISVSLKPDNNSSPSSLAGISAGWRERHSIAMAGEGVDQRALQYEQTLVSLTCWQLELPRYFNVTTDRSVSCHATLVEAIDFLFIFINNLVNFCTWDFQLHERHLDILMLFIFKCLGSVAHFVM